MKKLSYSNKQFRYGDMLVTRPFMRVLVRQIARERAEVELARLNRAFKQVAEHQGWGL